MTTFPVRVKTIRQEAIDIKSFLLVSADATPLPPFTPGAHIDAHVEGVVRQYSLCNGPDDSEGYLIAVKREADSRGGSRAMHELKEGDELIIGGPRNNFPIDPSARHHVLLAGGIGITPLLSMARHLKAAGASFELHYFTRTEQHTAFRPLLAGADFNEHVMLHCALAPEGLRTYLMDFLSRRSDGAHLYLCGPRPFMELVETIAAANHWAPQSVHLEYFAAHPAMLAGPQDEFTVRLARSGAIYTVPAGVPITEVLISNGCAIETSCEQGVCGTCLTGVIEGIPDHRDVYLTDKEKNAGDKMLPCVSRAKTPLLVLDL